MEPLKIGLVRRFNGDVAGHGNEVEGLHFKMPWPVGKPGIGGLPGPVLRRAGFLISTRNLDAAAYQPRLGKPTRDSTNQSAHPCTAG
jgi:hypothetical protein